MLRQDHSSKLKRRTWTPITLIRNWVVSAKFTANLVICRYSKCPCFNTTKACGNLHFWRRALKLNAFVSQAILFGSIRWKRGDFRMLYRSWRTQALITLRCSASRGSLASSSWVTPTLESSILWLGTSSLRSSTMEWWVWHDSMRSLTSCPILSQGWAAHCSWPKSRTTGWRCVTRTWSQWSLTRNRELNRWH